MSRHTIGGMSDLTIPSIDVPPRWTNRPTSKENEMEHIFTPIVTLTKRDDGNYTMQIDWSDSYEYTCDPASGATLDGDVGAKACAAVDEWAANTPTTFIIRNTEERSE